MNLKDRRPQVSGDTFFSEVNLVYNPITDVGMVGTSWCVNILGEVEIDSSVRLVLSSSRNGGGFHKSSKIFSD